MFIVWFFDGHLYFQLFWQKLVLDFSFLPLMATFSLIEQLCGSVHNSASFDQSNKASLHWI